ncbi:MAG: WecB/TagA/CpsF family glycosyltransferase [Oscillospiraceae bacterium]|nr:WecB/TagA/CpsF family glycosyltransferase [Oscillospiraceae bacterium]
MKLEDQKSRTRLNITNIGIDPVDVEGAAQIVAELVGRGAESKSIINGGHVAAYACTPNAEHMMDAQNDALFMRILNEADLVLPDGAGVVLAARLLGYGKITRAPGFDLSKTLVANPDKYPFTFYFLGGKPGIAEKAAANIMNEYPATKVVGWRDGYFTADEEPNVVEDINRTSPDILYVALGAPKAEKLIYRNRDKLNVSVCIGVGGTLDTFAGETKLAPPFFRAHGLEWLYRLSREPWRAKRMLKLPKYVIYTIRWKLAGRPALNTQTKP